MVETKTIVVDVDDTISTHTDRDYENANPHHDVIQKLRDLKALGWRIVLYTARGQLSCNGDLELIEKTRRPTLERWLAKHDVPYDELKFGKPLGVYYVDDKAMRPDEFLKARFEKLTGGSGADIEVAGDRVVKKGHNSFEQAAWYKAAAEKKIKVPRVNCAYGDTIDMQLIEGQDGFTALNKDVIKELILVIDNMSHHEDEDQSYWATMIYRVIGHLSQNAVEDESTIIDILINMTDFMDAHKSFSHGDLTLENIIVTRHGGVYVIDPNRPPGVYSSYLLDAAKVLQSLRGYEQEFYDKTPGMDLQAAEIAFLKDFTDQEVRAIEICLMVHYIRMLKYKSDKDKPSIRAKIHAIKEKYKDVPRS